MTDDLLDLLEARAGIVCAVGAGGKKTTLYHLAVTHPGRVGLTCTVPNANFPSTLGAHEVIADASAILPAVVEAASTERLVAFAHPSEKTARYAGLAPDLICEIRQAAGFDVVFVKGDGARMRRIKAPEEDEPVIPKEATTVIPIVSIRAIGAPLTEEVAHRLSRVEAITGAGYGEPIEPVHIARLLADEQGALKDTGDATVVPVINMVDDPERERLAVSVAQAALELTDRFDRVVLTSHQQTQRLVGVVAR
jgi:probable selenium-dependent hydroxylase accessory protein YqeC